MWSTSSNDMAIYTGYRPKRTNISLTLFADSMREVSILSLLQPLFLSISLIESHPVHPVEKVEKHMKSAPKKMWVHHANTVIFNHGCISYEHMHLRRALFMSVPRVPRVPSYYVPNLNLSPFNFCTSCNVKFPFYFPTLSWHSKIAVWETG